MRPLLLIPIAAFLGLAACDDAQQTAQTEPEATTTAPADTATAPPPATTETAPPQDTATAPIVTPEPTSPAPAQDMAATPTDPVDTTGAIGQDMMIQPGAYQSQNVSLSLEQDGTFMLTNPNTGDQAQGQYQQEGTFLTLMTQEQPEPMTCEVTPEGDGFTLTATDPSCEPLDGQTFQREG